MPISTNCPQTDTLQRLLRGELSPAYAEELLQHLELCDLCAAMAGTLPADSSLVAALRALPTEVAEEDQTLIASLIETASDRIGLDLRGDNADSIVPPAAGTVRQNQVPAEYLNMLLPPQQIDELGRLGPYRILQVLGQGGMGLVFLAEDAGLQRRVALKVIKPLLAFSPEARQRFLREARAAASIEDPHIVTIHHVGEDRGVPFIAMQLLQGRNLHDFLRDTAEQTGTRALPIADAVRIGSQIAQGLSSAHARGLIHRDIKPANIWLESAGAGKWNGRDSTGRVKLLDFGLARQINQDAGLTQPGVLAGTPAYLAPEQVRGDEADARCDLFSLGCVLYEMLTGRSPFATRSTSTTLTAITSAEPPAPNQLNPAVPAELAALVQQLLHKDPAQRPAAQEVAMRLRELAHTPAELAAATRHRRQTSIKTSARRLLAATIVIAGISVLATILAIRTPNGLLIIESNDPQIALQIESTGGVTLRDKQTGREFQLGVGEHRLPSGEYDVVVVESNAGITFSAREFKISEGDATRLRAYVDSESQSANGSSVDWMRQVAALPASEQVELVKDKLKQLNPQFDGHATARVLDGIVIEFEIATDAVTDVSPVAAFASMRKLVCRGSALEKGSLTDLSALHSLSALQVLDCSNNQISDLLPLQGLPLKELYCAGNPIEDLGAMADLPLEVLDISRTFIRDVQRLRGVPLVSLDIRGTYVRELWPLEDLQTLRVIDCYFRPHRDANSLRKMTFLRKINQQTAEQFWQVIDARRKSIDEWLPQATALPAEQKAAAVAQKLKELNPRFDGQVFPRYTDGKLTVFQVFTDNITDLEPLRALNHLERLTVRGTSQGLGKLYDLDPLRELPLVFLEAGFNEIGDLAPLESTGLRVLLLRGTRVRDLTPLRNVPLFYFECQSTPVVDLSPLAGRAISNLHIKNTRIRDYGPLATMNVHVLTADLDPQQDKAVLQSIRTLETLNNVPVSELWKYEHE